MVAALAFGPVCGAAWLLGGGSAQALDWAVARIAARTATEAAAETALLLAAGRLVCALLIVVAAAALLAPQWGWVALATPLGWAAQRFAHALDLSLAREVRDGV